LADDHGVVLRCQSSLNKYRPNVLLNQKPLK
jgi:hypothetical protein